MNLRKSHFNPKAIQMSKEIKNKTFLKDIPEHDINKQKSNCVFFFAYKHEPIKRIKHNKNDQNPQKILTTFNDAQYLRLPSTINSVSKISMRLLYFM